MAFYLRGLLWYFTSKVWRKFKWLVGKLKCCASKQERKLKTSLSANWNVQFSLLIPFLDQLIPCYVVHAFGNSSINWNSSVLTDHQAELWYFADTHRHHRGIFSIKVYRKSATNSVHVAPIKTVSRKQFLQDLIEYIPYYCKTNSSLHIILLTGLIHILIQFPPHTDLTFYLNLEQLKTWVIRPGDTSMFSGSYKMLYRFT